MASAVSSYLSKSKKDFKPKAPTRRTAAGGINNSSVHVSTEQQADPRSHIRQDSTTQPAILTSTPAFTNTTSTSSTGREKPTGSDALPQTNEAVTASRLSGSTQDATPGPEITAESARNPVVAPSTEASSEDRVDVEDAVAISLPRTRHLSQRAELPETPISTNSTSSRQIVAKVPIIESLSLPVTTPNRIVSTRGSVEPNSQPAAKRRRTNPPEKSAIVAQLANEPSNPAQGAQADQRRGNSTEHFSNLNDGASMQVGKPKKTRQTTKVMGKQRMEDLAAVIVADATRGGRESDGKGQKRQNRGKGPRKRAPTPENAESVRIEPGVITMADLCQDNRTGKKSKRETALQACDEEERSAKKADAQQLSVEAETLTENMPQRSAEIADVDAGAEDSNRSQLRALVPSVRIVNGQIVHDESSRTIDRVALANEARGDNEVVVVVDSLSHKVNSATYMKRERSSKWNEAMTDQFYDGLRMFGTDFSMICKMFPGKSRKAVKLKFSKEEKFFPQRIKSTLLGERLPVDMEEFSKMSNTIYRDPKELESDLAEDRKRLEEEQAKEKEAMEEAVRERAEEAAAEAAAESAEGGEDSSAKENNARDGDTGVDGNTNRKKAGRPPIKRSPVNKAQACKEARAAARVVARVLRPAPPT